MSVKKAREPALNAKINVTAKTMRLVHKKINAKMNSALQWVSVHNNMFHSFVDCNEYFYIQIP